MKRKLGMQGLTLLLLALAVVFVLLLNFTATLLGRSYPLDVDLTENKAFKLSEATIDSIAALDVPITIRVLAKEDVFADTSTYNAQANEILRGYEKHGPSITLQYVDYVRDPSFAAGYPNLSMKHGDILVSSPTRDKLVATEDLFQYITNAAGGLSIKGSRAEEAIASAIQYVTSERTVQVSLLTGHAEYSMPTFTEFLADNGYEVLEQNLALEGVSPESDVAVLLAPKTDLSAEEIAALDAFLENGGDYGKALLYFADAAEQGELPTTESFLQEWGVAIGDGAVFETDENRVYNYHPFYTISDYADETYAGMLRTTSIPALLPLGRPLETLWEYRDYYATKVLLEYGESTGVRPTSAGDDFVADDATQTGPLPALVLSSFTVLNRATGEVEKQSNLVVCASAGMLDSYSLGNAAFSNAEYLAALLADLTQQESTLVVQAKTLSVQGLNLSQRTSDTLGMVFIAVVPLAILAVGILQWLRRRHG